MLVWLVITKLSLATEVVEEAPKFACAVCGKALKDDKPSLLHV